MDGNGAQFLKIVRIGLDLGQTVDLKRYDGYRTFTKHDVYIMFCVPYEEHRNKVISQKYTGD